MKTLILVLLAAGCAGQINWPVEKCVTEEIGGVNAHVCTCAVEEDTRDPATGVITRTCDGVLLPFITKATKAVVK